MSISPAGGALDQDLELLLEDIYRRHHYDFRGYARGSIGRRVAQAQQALGCATVLELRARILSDEGAFTQALRHLTVRASDFFRDPAYYKRLRETVVPHLGTHPSPRIWVAGCAAGEEAYSIAVVLHEEGLLERSLIYATDIDAEALRLGRAGVIDRARVDGFAENYRLAGGERTFSDYCDTDASSRITFRPLLRRHILFSDHSLSTDSVFAEVQLVSCRNVLIYFDRELQDRAIGLFRESLCPRGFLGLGPEETVAFSLHASSFEPCALGERIYRLKSGRGAH